MAHGLHMGVEGKNRGLFQGFWLERMELPLIDTGQDSGETIVCVGEIRGSVRNVLSLRCSLDV